MTRGRSVRAYFRHLLLAVLARNVLLDFLALLKSKNIKYTYCLGRVTNSNCPKFTKMYSFLLIPHACPAFLKYVLSVNDACYFGHVWNFGHYIYFGVLISSVICFLSGFFRYTFQNQIQNQILKPAETLVFWWKLFKILYLCSYFVQKKVQLIAEKLSQPENSWS